ncbi:SAM-dependent methyltransferase [Kitasatospora sp. NPDC101801]|uniref:SAM-dependent methyltransferase n=1 Tax=Kitasatospora sp. NPDC101801 TaxID=3364103 RepID=UPI003823B320
MYDFLLGGVDNYDVDRDACGDLLEIVPGTRALARTNRDFLQRVVRTLAADYGIRQFLDHGSGLPTQDNVHQIAQRVSRHSRVVYIDNDPTVHAHGRMLLEENDQTAVAWADMTDTDAVFGSPEVRRLINLEEPVAALFVSVLHCIPDEADPAALIRRVAARLAPGSFMVICQLVSEHPDIRQAVTDFMHESTQGNWGCVRQQSDVDGYFAGLEILPPGLTEVSLWRPDSQLRPHPQDEDWIEYGGVARIPVSRLQGAQLI